LSESIFSRGDEPLALPASKAIWPAEKASIAPRASAEPPLVEMQYVNRSRNSRIGVPLGEGDRKLLWQAPLNGALQPPSVLLASPDRYLVYGDLNWELFDHQGRSLFRAPHLAEAVTLDAEWKRIYFHDNFGQIAAHNLADGKPVFTALLFHTQGVGRRLIARTGNLLTTVSYKLGIDAHQPEPQYSIVELTDLHGAANTKSWSDGGGPALMQELVARQMHVLPAMRAGTLALAMENTLAVVDAATLEPQALLTGTFRPQSLSMDEGRRMFLLADTGGGQTALWQVSPAGERIYSCPMPPGFPSAAAPPIIGFDHTVYIARGRFLLSVARDGKLNWSREAPSAITGAVVTADDQLVTTEGSQIAAWNPKGVRRVLAAFPEPLVTAPVLTREGELLAASRTRLYCAGR
jgi:hypothetical protein